MKRTGTNVFWPSKMKINAKTRKDPIVKIIGTESAVKDAKELILAKLQVKVSKRAKMIFFFFSDSQLYLFKARKSDT